MTKVIKNAAALIRSYLEVEPNLQTDVQRVTDSGTIESYPVRVRLLRMEEEIQCEIVGQKLAKEAGELAEFDAAKRHYTAMEVLTRAICHDELAERPDGTKFLRQVFVDPKQMRQSLTGPELGALLNAYEVVKATFNPLEEYDETQIEWIIEQLAHPLRGPLFLSQLDSRTLPNLTRTLAVLAKSLLPDRTTSDSPSTSGVDQSTSGLVTTSSSEPPSLQFPEAEVELPRGGATKEEAKNVGRAARAKRARKG